jgi:hypothetical protein
MSNIPKRLPKSLNGLRDMVKYINSKRPTKELTILEIGSWVGVSTEIFANNFKHVIAVDPWSPTVGINTQYNMSDVEKEFDKRVSKFDNVSKIKMPSEQASKKYNKSLILDDPAIIDVIYIDGAHDYKNVKLDIELWKDKVRYFICGHDFYNKFPGVKKAVRECLGEPDILFKDSSWLVEVK